LTEITKTTKTPSYDIYQVDNIVLHNQNIPTLWLVSRCLYSALQWSSGVDTYIPQSGVFHKCKTTLHCL